MRFIIKLIIWFLACVSVFHVKAALYINEVLFNPPGTDSPNEYIELRGTPNYVLPNGTYFVCVEGDSNGNPGIIQNIFDLSGVRVGGNGFIVLLQKNSPYSVADGATVLINTGSGSGWGSGNTSSIRHYGENSQTEIENPSVTFFLICTTNKPNIGDDIDTNNDGLPEPDIFGSWTVLDSIGILDSSGAGDIGYGLINYRANSDATVKTGRAVEINFTPSYVGRIGNTTNSTELDWVVSDNLIGSPPVLALGPPGSTLPTGFGMYPLNSIGAPNFNDLPIPGVILTPPTNPDLQESGGTNSYTLRFNTFPSGEVVVKITTDGQTLVSVDTGNSFATTALITFTNTNSVVVIVKAVDDNIVEGGTHKSTITHTIIQTYDYGYSTNTIIPDITFNIKDNEYLLLNEIKANPPGEDAPFEFVEIQGSPDAVLTNTYFVAINGSSKKNPGTLDLVIPLNGIKIGRNGLVVLLAQQSPYRPSPDTTTVYFPTFTNAGGILPNNAVSFMLIYSETPLIQGKDLDDNDNGTLEDLPKSAWIFDAIGWTSGNLGDIVYGGASISLPTGTPDAAVRFPDNKNRISASAWFYGQLFQNGSDTLEFDERFVSTNFPSGATLTPGSLNQSLITISYIAPISGVIGDPTNPEVTFRITNYASPTQAISVSVSANNPCVVSQTNIFITKISNQDYKMKIEPTGIGYSVITITATDGILTAYRSFYYAASEMGRPGGYFLTGASDASAAIAIDSDWMFVGDDENEVIRIYPRKRSGPPIAEFDMTPYLGLTDFEGERPREVDIEAAYRIGNRIYWVGAHSNSNIGEGRTNRARIFVTDIIGSGTNCSLVYVGRYDYLKTDLVNWDNNNGHGKGAGYYNLAYSAQDEINPKTPWGFNIEGVAPVPDNPQAAFIALRAPIVPPTNRVYALIVPVLNFTNIAGSGAPPGSAIFGQPIELDLFGRGIRDIVGNSNGYIIIAGTPYNSPGAYPHDFKIYTWSGRPDSPPQERSADLSGLIPEGIVELPPQPWDENTEIQVVSDCGTKVYYGDGVPAKLLPIPAFKKFRVDTVKLGKIVKTAPIITNFHIENGQANLLWRSIKDDSYLIQYKDSLTDLNWITIPTPVRASGTWTSFTDSGITNKTRFYRLLVQP